MASRAADFGKSAIAYPFTYFKVCVRPCGFPRAFPKCGANWEEEKVGGNKSQHGSRVRVKAERIALSGSEGVAGALASGREFPEGAQPREGHFKLTPEIW